MPRPYDRRKIEERRQEVKKKLEEKEKEDNKPPVRLTKSFIERMAVPKHPSPEKKDVVKEPTPVRVGCFAFVVVAFEILVGQSKEQLIDSCSLNRFDYFSENINMNSENSRGK